jgi:hypothetical protein
LIQPRKLESLFDYCAALAQMVGKEMRTGTIFAKFLTDNDDSGRHGVLVPTEAYDHFPTLSINDPTQNASREFEALDALSGESQTLSYKYYQRYPERRITRLNGCFSDKLNGMRLGLFVKAIHTDGSLGYFADCVCKNTDVEFYPLVHLIFGDDLGVSEGGFVLREVDAPSFNQDAVLYELLEHFDRVHSMGWINSMRAGDTGIGYTFETLVGIEENNDQCADYKGIEIKCKQLKGGSSHAGKINLFQQAPIWAKDEPSIERLRKIGKLEDTGRYSCYSQVTTTANNLQLALRPNQEKSQIDLLKKVELLGCWPYELLEARLQEKHSRTVFVKADIKTSSSGQQFRYKEVVYCERPSIERFVDLVKTRQLVFEFLMSEKEGSRVRNHGYPWRLISENLLSDLFSLQVKVR